VPNPGEAPISPADLIRQLTAAISGTDPRDLPAMLDRLTAAASPSRRGARRPDVVTYRVRVDLKGTKPPLWRRLELSSDLFLDQLHEVLQAAFGWTDTHLHQFGSGPEYYSRETEYYLCPYQVEEAETGIPEEDVRLDEVLDAPGDKLFYLYDFGDGWEHVIKLETVTARAWDRGTPAVCVDGRRDVPPEDCGGVGGFELISAAIDPANSDHDEAVAEFAGMYGDGVNLRDFDPTPFNLNAINEALAVLAAPEARPEYGEIPDHLPGPLGSRRSHGAR
jgi:Plasmid pRiA4b ORF-3-like protein